MSEPQVFLEVKDLKKHFPIHKGVFKKVVGHVKAVDGVTFSMNSGETLGLVGESGCGKTTVGRMIMGAYRPTAGTSGFSPQMESPESIWLTLSLPICGPCVLTSRWSFKILLHR